MAIVSSADVPAARVTVSVTVAVTRGVRWRLCHSIAYFIDSNPNLFDLVPNVLYPLDIVLESINIRYGSMHASHFCVCSLFAPVGASLARFDRSRYRDLNLKHVSGLPTRRSGVCTNLIDPAFHRPDDIL